jgi:hypothetical protein
MALTEVETTFGKTVKVDERERADLERQGLLVPAASSNPKTKAVAPATVDHDAEANAEADTRGGAE